MRTIVDLHIHSKYARACSKELTPQNIAMWCDKKGIGVVGTGDCTHPKWLAECAEVLKEKEEGLYVLPGREVRFMFTGEISSIYKQGDKVRRIHNLLLVPGLESASKLQDALKERKVNIASDGRPIMGLHCPDIVELCKEVDERIEIIPAHAWTPHFGLFGSLSGFDSIEEAFGNQAKYIFAIETGLSSDPKMNWQVSDLDNISLISNSDPHSLHRLGREANALDVKQGELSFAEVVRIIRQKDPQEFLFTIEFFPEEGRYHLDGHADCKFSCLPEETKKYGGICPVCKKKLLRGVMHRVDDLGDRVFGFVPERAIPFKNTVSLEELIADIYNMGVASKKVQGEYERVIGKATEFSVLLDLEGGRLREVCGESLAVTIERMRKGLVHIEPGYDGLYGKIHVYTEAERDLFLNKQASLF